MVNQKLIVDQELNITAQNNIAHILIVEDDQMLGSLLARLLSEEGFSSTVLHDGTDVLDHVKANTCDVVLLDIMLPRRSGFEILGDIREISDIPVIVLTALSTEMERIRVFQLGADDYLAKPYFTSELIFRINNALKRQYRIEEKQQLVSFGPLQLDRSSRKTYLEGKDLNLTDFEHEILFVLVSNSGKPLDRNSIYQHAVGSEFEFNARNMDVKIAHLRKKLGKWQGMIRTIWGVGYEIMIPDTI